MGTVAEITMRGEIGLGDKQNPRYLPMRARQIIAPPFGLIWKLQAGSRFTRIHGSDGIVAGRSWVRFWLWNIIPVVRIGGGDDHARSAFGRVAAEAVFFTPAALLPGKGVEWHMINHKRARALISYRGMIQTVDVAVDAEGRPLHVTIIRWSNANPEKTYKYQPFGGTLSEFRKFDGFMLPTKIEGGNFFGTPEYFPFYKAQIEEVRFL